MSSRQLPLVPLSICLCAKNERRNLKPFHESISAILGNPKDEVILVDTGSVDGTQELAKSLGYRVIERPELCSLYLNELGEKWMPKHWGEFSQHAHFREGLLRSFSEARQIGFDAAKNEHCLWLDLDDELVNPWALRSFVDQLFLDGKKGGLFLRYDYAHDGMDGACTTTLWRERVVTKSTFQWKGLCHETMIPLRTDLTMARDVNFPCFVRHRAPKPHKFSDLRNYIVLRNDLEMENNHDPRTLFYLGNACRGLGEHKEALEWYSKFVHQSGSKDDIMSARLSMAACYAGLGRLYRAIAETKTAQLTDPRDPRVYYTEANLWSKLENWRNVLSAVQLGDQFQMPDTLHAVDPVGIGFQPAALATLACRELRMPDQAVRFAERAFQVRSQYKVAREMLEDTQRWAAAEEGGQMLSQMLKMSPNPKKILENIIVSPHLAPFGLGTPEASLPGAAAGTKTVAFWCGVSAEPWGPDSRERGIGASEKMVVDLAGRLAKRGFSVSVYCSLSCSEGEYDGVHWRQIGHFNPDLFRDFVVLWRDPHAVQHTKFNAGKLFCWMHDARNGMDWPTEVVNRIDKVFFLTDFHRKLHMSVPDEKVYITRNGIPLDAYTYDGRPKKKKVVYLSSPDRGYQNAIRTFKKSRLPELGYSLHLFYGFGKTWRMLAANNRYMYVTDVDCAKDLYEYEDDCLAECDGETVVYRGRVGWDVIAEELKESELWLYPTQWNETSCVSAMECMAAGLKIISNRVAALDETIGDYPGFIEVSPTRPASDRLVGMVNKTLKDKAHCRPSDEEIVGAIDKAIAMEWKPDEWKEYAKRFDIEELADQWTEVFINESTPSGCAT